MLSGKQKSQLLISLIEENSSEVLKCLSEESATLLSSSLEDLPELDDKQIEEFLKDTLQEIDKKNSAMDTPEDDLSDLDNLEESDESADLDFDDIEEDEEKLETDEDKEKKSSYPDNYRSCDYIVEKLLEQKDQIIAFFLKNCDENLVKDLKEFIPEEKIEEINNIFVDNIPMSERVFKKLFDMIVLKSEEDLKKESETDASNENSNDSLDL